MNFRPSKMTSIELRRIAFSSSSRHFERQTARNELNRRWNGSERETVAPASNVISQQQFEQFQLNLK